MSLARTTFPAPSSLTEFAQILSGMRPPASVLHPVTQLIIAVHMHPHMLVPGRNSSAAAHHWVICSAGCPEG